MATHSSILAWKIPWTEEPDGKELDRTEPLTCTCWVYLLPGKQDLAPRLFLTVCFSLVLHPLPSPTESAPCNPGKVLETERRVFPVIREMRNTERLCAREPHRARLASTETADCASPVSFSWESADHSQPIFLAGPTCHFPWLVWLPSKDPACLLLYPRREKPFLA